jgi:hypothetical protein
MIPKMKQNITSRVKIKSFFKTKEHYATTHAKHYLRSTTIPFPNPN